MQRLHYPQRRLIFDLPSVISLSMSANSTFQSLPAGNDVEMGGGKYSFARVPALVAAGKLPMSVVDTAVSRVLRAKFALGLFENPYQGVADADLKKFINTDEHKQLARELDADSIVLLENHNNVLPLKKTASIAVIGPMAHGYVNVRIPFPLISWPLVLMYCDLVRRLCHPYGHDSRCDSPRRHPGRQSRKGHVCQGL